MSELQDNSRMRKRHPNRPRTAILIVLTAFALWNVLGCRKQQPPGATAPDSARQEALRYLTQAKAANSSKDDETLARFATAQAKAGDVTGAMATVNAMTDEVQKHSALIDIAVAQAKAGDVAGAKATANSLDDGGECFTLIKIALAQARAGDQVGARQTFEKALTPAGALDSEKKASALSEVATAQARSGDIVAALDTVNAITDSSFKARGMVAIGDAQAQAGDQAAANQTFDQVKVLADAITDDTIMDWPAEKEGLLCDLAGAESQSWRLPRRESSGQRSQR